MAAKKAGTTNARKKGKARKTTARSTIGPRTTAKAQRKSSAPKKKIDPTPLGQIRAICLALSDVTEVLSWGAPTFRVKKKIFAMYASPDGNHSGGRPGIWIYADPLEQDFVIRSRPNRYFKPPYVGPSGWIGAWLDKNPPWREIAELLRDSHERRAKK
jgi:predicted DNA-binding protein (MmcQ/YjbR family)